MSGYYNLDQGSHIGFQSIHIVVLLCSVSTYVHDDIHSTPAFSSNPSETARQYQVRMQLEVAINTFDFPFGTSVLLLRI